MKIDLSFRPSNLEKMWESWLTPLRYREPTLIVSYPGNDNYRRLQQMKEEIAFVSKTLQTRQSIYWIELDYRQKTWETAEMFLNSVEREARVGSANILLLRGFEKLIKDHRTDLVIALRELYRRDSYRVMLVCENNYYDPDNEKFVLSLRTFEPRVVALPLYGLSNVQSFVWYLANKWDLHLTDVLVDEVVAKVGGSLGLLKQVVWYLRDHGVESLDEALGSEQVLWQVKSLWDGLTRSDREYLRYVAYDLHTRDLLPMTRSYLTNIGFLTQEDIITIPILYEYIHKYEQNPRGVVLDGEQILINQQDFGSHFTDKQKLIMKELLQNKGKIVLRERLMELLWGSDEAGSDWAFDSQINRLREKLKVLGIGERHLVTKRGKGLSWLM